MTSRAISCPLGLGLALAAVAGPALPQGQPFDAAIPRGADAVKVVDGRGTSLDEGPVLRVVRSRRQLAELEEFMRDYDSWPVRLFEEGESCRTLYIEWFRQGRSQGRMGVCDEGITYGPSRGSVAPGRRLPLRARERLVKILGVAWPSDQERSLSYWIEQLSSPDRLERLEAVESITAMGPRAADAVPHFIALLSDSDDTMRTNVAGFLPKLGDGAKAAVPALRGMLKDPNGFARVAAAASLWAIARSPEAIPALVAELKAADWQVRNAAADRLGAIGPSASAAVPALAEALQTRDSFAGQKPPTVLVLDESLREQALRAAAEADKGALLRWTVAEALGKIGPSAVGAIPALTSALADPDPEVREMAAAALRRIKVAH